MASVEARPDASRSARQAFPSEDGMLYVSRQRTSREERECMRVEKAASSSAKIETSV